MTTPLPPKVQKTLEGAVRTVPGEGLLYQMSGIMLIVFLVSQQSPAVDMGCDMGCGYGSIPVL